MLGEQEVVSALQAGRREFLGCEEPGFVQAGDGVGQTRQTSEQQAGSSSSKAAEFKPCLEVCGAHGKGDQGPCVENWKEPGGPLCRAGVTPFDVYYHLYYLFPR